MPTKLIKLTDDTLIEVEARPNEVEQISSTFADRVEKSLETIVPIIVKVSKPIMAACQQLDQGSRLEQAEVELSLSFEGEGNVYITKAKAGANITIKLIIKPHIN